MNRRQFACRAAALGFGVWAARTVRAETLPERPADRVLQVGSAGPTGEPSVVTAVALSPDGSFLATGSDDHVVRIWNAQDGRLLRSLNGHSDWVRVATFDPAGTALVTAGDDRQIRVWDFATGRSLRTLGGPTAP